MRLTASIIRAAPTSASRRRGIGVGPACASCPVTVISYQRWPCAGDDADRQPGRFEDRPLLDMRLEIGADRAAADRLGTGKADARQLGAEADAGGVVGPGEAVFEVEDAG